MSHEPEHSQTFPVTVYRKPFEQSPAIRWIEPGQTVREVVAAAFEQPEYAELARVQVNGQEVFRAHWDLIIHYGDVVTVAVVPEGDVFGGNTLRNVLSLVLVAGGALASNAIGGPLGWIIGTGISLVGPWILHQLIPVPEIQDLYDVGYSLSGVRNQAFPWETIPKIYGRHRVYPPLGARYYTEVHGDDQFLRFLLVLGFGPLKLDLETMRFGDAPVFDGEGDLAYDGLEIEVLEGYADDPDISLVSNDTGEEDIGAFLGYEPAIPEIHTTETDTDEISLDIEFPDGLARVDGGDVNGWSVNFRIRYRPAGFGDDAWLEVDEPLAAALNDLTAILTAEERIAYLATVETTIAEQAAVLEGIPLEDRVMDEPVHRTLLEYVQIWTNALNGMDPAGNATLADSIADALTELLHLDDVLATYFLDPMLVMLPDVLRAADIVKKVVDFLVELERVNNYIAQGYGPALSTLPWWGQLLVRRRGLRVLFGDPPPEAVRITAAKTGVVRRGFRWRVPRGEYDVWVERVSPLSPGTDGVSEAAYWTKLRSVHYQKPINKALLPPLALMAVRVKASEDFNGVVNQLNLVATSVLPVAEPDGEGGYDWALAETRNPAWCFVDALTGASFPRPVALARLDLDAIYEWAQACDDEVFKETGEEDRTGRTFDLVISRHTTADKIARTIASTGRASMSAGTLYTVVRDVEQESASAYFSPANSWAFSAEKAHGEPPHGLRVYFVDETADWQQAERLVFADGYDVETATRYETITLTGVTNARQTFADARYFLAVAKLRPRRFTWSCDLQWALGLRGRLVRVTHDVALWGTGFGRIVSIAVDGGTTTLRLDNAVPLAAASSYQLIAVYPDGYGHTVDLEAVAEDGYYAEVSTVDGFPSSPATDHSAGGVALAAGGMVMVGETSAVSHDLIVTSVEADSLKQARIIAVDAAPGVHRDPNDPIPPFESGITIPPELQQPAPVEPVIRQYPVGHPDSGAPMVVSDERVLVLGNDGRLMPRIVIYLETPVSPPERPVPAVLQRQYRRVADSEEEGAVTLSPWATLPDVPAGELEAEFEPVRELAVYDLHIRYAARDGRASAWVTVQAHEVIGKTAPPPDVTTLLLDNNNLLRWFYDPPLDFRRFEVRYHPGIEEALEWEDAERLGYTTAPQFSIESLGLVTATFFVKAHDTSGNESVNAAVLRSNITPGAPRNVLIEKAFQPDWDDPWILAVHGEIIDGKVYADFASDDLFWTGEDEDLFWTGEDEDLFWNFAWTEPRVILNFATPAGAAGSEMLVRGAVEDSPGLILEYVAKMPEGITDPLPVPARIVLEEDAGYRITARALVGSPGSARPALTEYELVIDVPDIVERFEDVEIPSGSASDGIRLPIQREYHKIVGVGGLTLQDTATGAVVLEVIDKGSPSAEDPTDGPLIKAKNAAGSYVGATFDAEVWGY